MKAYTAELDCLRALYKKLKSQIDVMEEEYFTTRSEGYKNFLAADIVKMREALVSVEKTKQLLEIVEL